MLSALLHSAAAALVPGRPCPTATAADVVSHYRASKSLPHYVNRGGTAVVTGGNSGIGWESAIQLAAAGCDVVVCSRNTENVPDSMMVDGIDVSGRIRVQQLDLADLSSVEAAVSEIAKHGEVSLLLNNAGVMATPKTLTKHGFELQFGTNHLGHFALTRLLLPHMADDGRVVTVASTAHTSGKVDIDNLNFERKRFYTPWGAYGQSKAANILFAKGLADELERAGSNILSVSLHPGVVGTPLWRHGNRFLTWVLHKVILDKDVEQGAATSLYGALAPSSLLPPGAYLKDCAEATPDTICADAEGKLRTALWEKSERLIAGAGLALPKSLLSKAKACAGGVVS